jgi:hypothetical protein
MPRKKAPAAPVKPRTWFPPFMPHEIDVHPDGKRIQATIDEASADAAMLAETERDELESELSGIIGRHEDRLSDLRWKLEAIRTEADGAPEGTEADEALQRVAKLLREAIDEASRPVEAVPA